MHKCNFKVLCKPAVMSKLFCPWACLVFWLWARAACSGSEAGHLHPYVGTKERAEEEPPPLKLSSDRSSELLPHKPNTFGASTNWKSATFFHVGSWDLPYPFYITVNEGVNFINRHLCWYNPRMAFLGFTKEPQATPTFAVFTWELWHGDGARLSMWVRAKSKFKASWSSSPSIDDLVLIALSWLW